MPFAPAVSPQAPHADMSGWGRALLQALGMKDARAEKAKEEAQSFKTYVAMGKQLGLNPDELTTKDLGTVRGMVEGHITQKNLQQAMERDNVANQRDYMAILADKAQMEGQQQAAAQQQAGLEAIPGFMADLGYQPQTPEAPLNREQILARAMERNPNIRFVPGNTMMSQMLESAVKLGGGTGAPMPEGFVPLGASMDENGKLDVRYGPPKAEGKALTAEEVNRIAALDQAETDLNSLEEIFKGLGANYGGPVSGRVKSIVMGGQNPNISMIDNAITAATPNLARGVFREVGVLTDEDIKRYKSLLPAATDTEEVRARKVKQLRERISKGREEMMSSLKGAGRNVSGFDGGKAGPATASPTRFDSEEAARSAGAKAGDVIEMYDPATATYRKARLK